MVNTSEIFKPNHWLQQLELNTYPSHTQALAGTGARLHEIEEWGEWWYQDAWLGTERGKGQ